MLAVYLIALAIGGVMLALTLVGGDGEGADGHDGDGHGEVGHAGGALDLMLGWLPITSLRFWIVFAAFFGLTGTALTLGGLLGPEPLPGLVAGGVGWLAGVMVVSAIRRLGKTEVSSGVGERDLVGATAEVLVSVSKDSAGKVRVRMKDRAVDMTATTEDESVLAEGVEVVVYAVEPRGGVVVTRGDAERS
jgi:hypothetical protein